MRLADTLTEKGLHPKDIEFTYEPKNTVAVTGKDAEKVILLVSKLEELDDVQNVYANFDISEEELEAIMAEIE